MVMNRARHFGGFTVVELLMVMVMVGVMAALAAPNMREMIVRIRLKTAASDLHSALIIARSEAIKRNAGMQVVPVDAANWALGWSVRIQASGIVLSTQDMYQNIAFTTGNAAYVATPVAAVTYSGTGRETGSAGAGVSFTITAPALPNVKARCVLLDPSGRPAVKQDVDVNPANGCN
jgi:type IV fimbrial biogenesis protein FimT